MDQDYRVSLAKQLIVQLGISHLEKPSLHRSFVRFALRHLLAANCEENKEKECLST